MAAKMIAIYAQDFSGNVLASAKFYHYQAGTTTLNNVYTDSSLTTPAANPVVCDAGGFAVVWADTALDDYKFELYDSGESTKYFTQNNITTADFVPFILINPFLSGDQTLTTTSTPQFAGMTLTDVLTMSGANIDLAGNRIILDADNDSYIDVSADDDVDIVIGGTTVQTWTGAGTQFTGTLAGNVTMSGQVTFSNTIDVSGISNKATVRNQLGLAIGSDVQAHDADLDTIAALSNADGNFIVGGGSSWGVEAGATARASMGVTIGSDVLAYDSNLQTFVDNISLPTTTPTTGQSIRASDNGGNTEWANLAGSGDVIQVGSNTFTGLLNDFTGSTSVKFADGAFTIEDSDDATKKFHFDAGSITGGQDRAITVPDLAGTLALTDAAQTISAAHTFSGNIVLTGSPDFSGVGNKATLRGDIGLAIGSDVQAFDAGLASIAGLTTAADKGVYTTASDTYATFDLTSAGRALLDDADAAAQRTTLGLTEKLVTASAIIVDDLTALKALTTSDVSAGDTVYMRYRSSAGDNGGGFFNVLSGSAASNSLTADDGAVVENTDGDTTFVRVFNGPARPEWFGVTYDAQRGDDADIDTGVSATTLTSSAGGFNDNAVAGQSIWVRGAGAAGADLVTTISSVDSDTQLTLTDAASTTVSGARFAYGSDETSEWQACLDYAMGVRATSAARPLNSAPVVSAQKGLSYVSGTLYVDGDNFSFVMTPGSKIIRWTDYGHTVAHARPRNTEPTGHLIYNGHLELNIVSESLPTSGSMIYGIASRYSFYRVRGEGAAHRVLDLRGAQRFRLNLFWDYDEDIYTSSLTPDSASRFVYLGRNGSGATSYSAGECEGVFEYANVQITSGGTRQPYHHGIDIASADGIWLTAGVYCKQAAADNIHIEPMDSETSVTGVKAASSWFDRAASKQIHITGTTNQSFANIQLTDIRAYGGDSDPQSDNFLVVDSADVSDVSALGCSASNLDLEAVKIIDGDRVSINDCTFREINQSNTADTPVVLIGASSSNASVINSRLGYDSDGTSGNAVYGVEIESGATSPVVENNDTRGNATNGVLNSAGAGAYLWNNKGDSKLLPGRGEDLTVDKGEVTITHEYHQYDNSSLGTGSGVSISSIVDNGGGNCRVTTSSAHGLEVGDVTELSSTGEASLNTIHVVTAVGSSTEFDTDVAFAGSPSGGTSTRDDRHIHTIRGGRTGDTVTLQPTNSGNDVAFLDNRSPYASTSLRMDGSDEEILTTFGFIKFVKLSESSDSGNLARVAFNADTLS